MAIANDHFLCVKRSDGKIVKGRGLTALPSSGHAIAFRVAGVTRYANLSDMSSLGLKVRVGNQTLWLNNRFNISAELDYTATQVGQYEWEVNVNSVAIVFPEGGFTGDAQVDVTVIDSTYWQRGMPLTAGMKFVSGSITSGSTTIGGSYDPPVIPVNVVIYVFGITTHANFGFKVRPSESGLRKTTTMLLNVP